MVKYLKNQNGNMYIFLIIFIFLFMGISTLVLDFGNMNIQNKKMKSSINLAVKASSLQIKDEEELANGNFLIDEERAKNVFYDILCENLGLNRDTLEPLNKSVLYKKPIIKELVVINNAPTTYNSLSINKSYNIENPSVVAVVEFHVRGLFLSKNIIIDKLSSSQLTSIYD